MFKQADYVMITVSDMAKSTKFYRDTLGLPLKFESPDWTEFDTGKTVLALHGGGTVLPTTESNKAKSHAGTCSIGFYVENLDNAFTELKAKGVQFVMPPTEREVEGIKLALCVDPDGLVISIAQPVTQEQPMKAPA